MVRSIESTPFESLKQGLDPAAIDFSFFIFHLSLLGCGSHVHAYIILESPQYVKETGDKPLAQVLV